MNTCPNENHRSLRNATHESFASVLFLTGISQNNKGSGPPRVSTPLNRQSSVLLCNVPDRLPRISNAPDLMPPVTSQPAAHDGSPPCLTGLIP